MILVFLIAITAALGIDAFYIQMMIDLINSEIPILLKLGSGLLMTAFVLLLNGFVYLLAFDN